MKEKLTEINDLIARDIQLSSVQDEEEEDLPLESFYASVIIRINEKYSSSDASEVTKPEDIFKKDGKYARRIYLLGDAARGKTTFCKWLLRKWCDAKRKEKTEIEYQEFDQWEREMKRYDFVFLIRFRFIRDPNLVSVKDLICQDVFESNVEHHKAICHVLSSVEYKCLIIMDGLEEWNYDRRIPKIDVSGGVTCFIAMRPWLFPVVYERRNYPSERVLEILGLRKTEIGNVVEKVLINYYKLEKDSLECTDKFRNILKHLKDQNVLSLMQIPLLAVVCVQIWSEKKQMADSITSFYSALLNMLIERAYGKYSIRTEHDRTERCELPKILSIHGYIDNCFSILLRVGKVAYEGLISDEVNLVLQKSKIEKEIGTSNLQFALDVGLISQKGERSRSTENISLHFFHKSIQEFLAAIYISFNKEVGDSFRKQLSNIKVITNLCNVIRFICGMNPSLGISISKHIVNVADNDTEICKYRESPPLHGQGIVSELYKIQISWYMELLDKQTHNPITFHVSDVNLGVGNNDIHTMTFTKKLLSCHQFAIKSLMLWGIPTGITGTDLNKFLCNEYNTRSLVMLYINGFNTDISINPIFIPTLKLLNLRNVKISHPQDLTEIPSLRKLELCSVILNYRGIGLSYTTSLRELDLYEIILRDIDLTLSHLTSLREINMHRVTFEDNGLCFSAHMVHLEKIRLVHVNMLKRKWLDFIHSLKNIKHTFKVELSDKLIIDEIKANVTSPDFIVTEDAIDEYIYRNNFYFSRVWLL